jgi:hypothetical protein
MSTSLPNIDKAESRSIYAQIRRVLLDVWDPTGIRDEPNAQNEYDMYIGDIFELLKRNASTDEIAKYLHWVAHDRMGFDRAQIRDMDETTAALKLVPLR